MTTFNKKDILQKWVDIVDNDDIDNGREDCLLCHAFFGTCAGCPIKEHTGISNCDGSPYVDWSTHHAMDHYSAVYSRCMCDRCTELATAMLDFLDDVIPDDFTLDLD